MISSVFTTVVGLSKYASTFPEMAVITIDFATRLELFELFELFASLLAFRFPEEMVAWQT